ncbi:MAG: hypothetical protein WC917_03490, partial [Bacilli bacterium]
LFRLKMKFTVLEGNNMFKQYVDNNQTVLVINQLVISYRILNSDEVFLLEGNILMVYNIYTHQIVSEEFIDDLAKKSEFVKTLK